MRALLSLSGVSEGTPLRPSRLGHPCSWLPAVGPYGPPESAGTKGSDASSTLFDLWSPGQTWPTRRLLVGRRTGPGHLSSAARQPGTRRSSGIGSRSSWGFAWPRRPGPCRRCTYRRPAPEQPRRRIGGRGRCRAGPAPSPTRGSRRSHTGRRTFPKVVRNPGNSVCRSCVGSSDGASRFAHSPGSGRVGRSGSSSVWWVNQA